MSWQADHLHQASQRYDRCKRVYGAGCNLHTAGVGAGKEALQQQLHLSAELPAADVL